MANILIVEDEAILAMNAGMDVEKMGHHVVGMADTGEKAVEIAVKTRPDIILMDIALKGGKNGIETAMRINEAHRCHIIYLTAHADPATLEKVQSTRHSGFIQKPYEMHRLQSIIEKALMNDAPARG